MTDASSRRPETIARTVFFALVGITVVAVGAFFNLRTDDPSRVAELVTDSVFLAGLRDQSDGDGCIALQSMDHVDVLVVGSSHAGAGIDPYTLASDMPELQTAVCAMPAWTMGHFDLLFEFLRDEDLHPQRLIWVADIGAALDLPQSEQSLASARQVFQSRTHHRRARDRWLRKLDRNGAPFELDEAGRETRLDAQAMALEGIDLRDLQAVLDAEPPLDLVRLGRALGMARSLADSDLRLSEICERAGERFGQLDIVVSPTPQRTQRYLQSLDGAELPETQDAYAAMLDGALGCASSLQSKPLSDWGLDERHFINRTGDPDYPYHVWQSVEVFNAETTAFSRRELRTLYDSNHLNPVGAVLFTRAVIESFETAEPLAP